MKFKSKNNRCEKLLQIKKLYKKTRLKNWNQKKPFKNMWVAVHFFEAELKAYALHQCLSIILIESYAAVS